MLINRFDSRPGQPTAEQSCVFSAKRGVNANITHTWSPRSRDFLHEGWYTRHQWEENSLFHKTSESRVHKERERSPRSPELFAGNDFLARRVRVSFLDHLSPFLSASQSVSLSFIFSVRYSRIVSVLCSRGPRVCSLRPRIINCWLAFVNAPVLDSVQYHSIMSSLCASITRTHTHKHILAKELRGWRKTRWKKIPLHHITSTRRHRYGWKNTCRVEMIPFETQIL